jgi:hypothetical protein
MRFSRVVTASDSQWRSCNCPGPGFGSGSSLKLVSDPDLDQKLAKLFFVLKFLRSLIFKAAFHQLCDLATNKMRKNLQSMRISHIYAYCLCTVSLPHAGEHKVHLYVGT